MADLLKRFEQVSLPIWERISIQQVGFWITEVGVSNYDLMYLLAWESMAEREQEFSAFQADSEWLEQRGLSESNGPLPQLNQSTRF